MKKRVRNPKLKATVTEEHLLKHFKKYQKVLEQWASEYSVLPPEASNESQEPICISEPVFFYQVHTSP